jgi:hypothetical protein
LVPNSRKPRQSCFISYSSEDSEFASLLQSELNKHNVPYWYAPEHAVWGKELHSQLRQAIAEKDRVIFICSKASLSNSDWVQYELVGTFEEEERRRKDGREDWRMAFLIMLDDFLNSWDHYLKPRLTQVLAGDFRSARRRGERFQRAVARLLEGLALPQQD